MAYFFLHLWGRMQTKNGLANFLVLFVPLVFLFLLLCNKGGYPCEDNIHFV